MFDLIYSYESVMRTLSYSFLYLFAKNSIKPDNLQMQIENTFDFKKIQTN
jgi:hypothetical protein